MKKIKQFIEYYFLIIFFFILNFFPIDLVSLLGGKIFKIIGPLTNSHKTAISNYKKIFQNLDNKSIRQDILKSWENLGKTFIELSILNKLLNKKNNRIKLLGEDNIKKIKKNNQQVIFFGIHQGNWELLVPTISKLGIDVGAIYRHINNPLIDKLILEKRNITIKDSKTFYTPKGKESAKEIIKAINDKLSIILLIDQKDSAGENIKFFGIDAKTQLGFLKIARKYKCNLMPVQMTRKKNNNFLITFHSPINIFEKDINDTDAMIKIHSIIESWIKENPTQWFWQHSRFN